MIQYDMSFLIFPPFLDVYLLFGYANFELELFVRQLIFYIEYFTRSIYWKNSIVWGYKRTVPCWLFLTDSWSLLQQNEGFSSPFLFSFASVLCLGQFDSSRSAAVHWSHFVHFWSLHLDANQTHGLLHHQRRSFPMSTTARDWREAANYSIPQRFRHRTIGSFKVSENVLIFCVTLFFSRFKLNSKFVF